MCTCSEVDLREKIEPAFQHANTLVKIAPNWWRSLQLYGETWVAKGQVETGGAWLYFALQSDPQNELVLVRLAELYKQLGKIADATLCCERALRQNPKNAWAKSLASTLG